LLVDSFFAKGERRVLKSSPVLVKEMETLTFEEKEALGPGFGGGPKEMREAFRKSSRSLREISPR